MTYAAHAAPPFYHGSRADLKTDDLLAPGFTSNYADRKLSWIYFSATLDAAIWGCELAKGEGRERITSSSRPDRSRTTPTSPTRDSREIRPNPTAPASRFGSSGKSPNGRAIRRSGSRR
jgi:hypothetical protein